MTITMGRRPNVAVIGAGLSGLRCADILIQNGARVTLFEARDRVGGRVRLRSICSQSQRFTNLQQVHQQKIHEHLIDL